MKKTIRKLMALLMSLMMMFSVFSASALNASVNGENIEVVLGNPLTAPQTELHTEPLTEPETELQTELPTEPLTEPETELQTELPTEQKTEPKTEALTGFVDSGETWYVVGVADLCNGENWVTGAEVNKMTWNNVTGLYEITFKQVGEGASKYDPFAFQFKVSSCTEGKWDNGDIYPEDNMIGYISAQDDVKVSYNPTTHEVNWESDSAVTSVSHKYRVAGSSEFCGSSFDPEDDNNLMIYNEATGRYEKVYENLPKNDVNGYKFKITMDGVIWYPDGMNNDQIFYTNNESTTVTIWYDEDTKLWGVEGDNITTEFKDYPIEIPVNPSKGIEYKGHYYKIFKDVCQSWDDAMLYCSNMGGYLATISSQEENDFLFKYMKSCGYDNAYFGFTDKDNEGVWEWVSGEDTAYTNWHEAEPNNENGNGDEDYAMFYWKFSDGTWNDGNFGNGTENDDKIFICEWDNKNDFDDNYFVIGEDTNRFMHKGMTYTVINSKYKLKLYKDSLNTWSNTFMICNELHDEKEKGVCHGIALSMCYANQGEIDCNSIYQGASNYWEMGSPYNNDKTKFKDIIIYYQLTQLTANGNESYSVSKGGWHINTEEERLKKFLKQLCEEARRSQEIRKPFVFSYKYKKGNKDQSGHSVVVCGYDYNEKTGYDIKIYDENVYRDNSTPIYKHMKIASDFSSFSFVDANGLVLEDYWTKLEVYDIDKLYGGNSDSVSVVNYLSAANNKTYFYIAADKKFKLINDKGEFLEYDGNDYTGNMTVYDCVLSGDPEEKLYWKITIDQSSYFEFENVEDGCGIIGENLQGGYEIESENIDGIKITENDVQICGNNYEFEAALQNPIDQGFYKITGAASGNIQLYKEDDELKIEADGYIESPTIVDYGFDKENINDIEGKINGIKIDENSGEVSESKPAYISGDINGDKVVDAKDRMTLTRYLAGWQGYAAINKAAADLNGDGIVNAKDRMIITRHIAGWRGYETLPIAG